MAFSRDSDQIGRLVILNLERIRQGCPWIGNGAKSARNGPQEPMLDTFGAQRRLDPKSLPPRKSIGAIFVGDFCVLTSTVRVLGMLQVGSTGINRSAFSFGRLGRPKTRFDKSFGRGVSEGGGLVPRTGGFQIV